MASKDYNKNDQTRIDQDEIEESSKTLPMSNQNGKDVGGPIILLSSPALTKTLNNNNNKSRDSRMKRRRRQKCKEFNDVISCYLCRGYLINATTIDYCFHSYCRSCIVQHLNDKRYCPRCGEGSKEINLSNLRTDDCLKAVVFKLIPGLHQKELKKYLNFNSDKNIARSLDLQKFEEEDFFAPGEPISLSLEYHPKALECFISKDQIPPVRYLQCPAAVTMHHLKRFICSKFDIDPENQRVDIEIIYEDEILADDFSLMDVGYCYNWTRVDPMRFYYRILLYHISKALNRIENYISNEKNSDKDKVNEAKSNKKSNEAVTSKTVRFKDINIKTDEKKSDAEKTLASNEETTTIYTVFKTKSSPSVDEIDQKQMIQFNNNNNNNNTNNQYDEKKDIKQLEGNGHLKIIIAKNDMKVKNEEALIKNLSPSDKVSPNAAISNDFKSLRSNDVRYNEIPGNAGTSTNGKVVKTQSPKTKNLTTNKIVELNQQKPVSKFDIVVSIPQTQIHRTSNSSDDSFENLSLAQLKTANKKNASSVSPREYTSSFAEDKGKDSKNKNKNGGVKEHKSKEHKDKEHKDKDHKDKNRRESKEKDNKEKKEHKQHKDNNIKEEKEKKQNDKGDKWDSIKLKIERNSLKTKITLPKKSAEPEAKKISKERKFSIEEPQLSTNEVDLTTYAKVIGLKPIKPIIEEKKELTIKNSPDASPASATSSSSSSGSGAFIFTSEEVFSSSSHKKRKKGKHSKEPKDSKKRKLHAEIASQPINQPESLKLKVKITPSHKTHKSDRKQSDSDVKVISVETIEVAKKIIEIPSAAPIVSSNIQIQKPKTPVNDEPTKPNKLPELPKVISNQNLNKSLSENDKIIDQKTAKPQHFVNSNKKQNFIPQSIATSTSPKYIPQTNTSVKKCSNNKTYSPTMPNQNQFQNNLKQLPNKVLSIQDTKLPVSPPLPPSLFKTSPINMQTVTTTSATATTTNMNSVPKPIMQHRMSMNQHQQMALNQMNRMTKMTNPRTTAANFVVPNPPRGIASNKLFPIGSIASQQNRQAAALKRSASLDSSPPTLTKQLKLEQDRLIRKSAYASILNPTSTSSGITSSQNIMTTTTSSNFINRNSPSSGVVITSVGNTKGQEQIFYTSTMGPTYTHENMTKKPVPILLPPSSISVTKMVDTFPNSIITSPSGLTITPQEQQQPSQFPYQQQNKPALEIVRIQSNIPPIDQQQFPLLNNNTIKQSPTKATRPPPPPIPLVKIKKSLNQSQPLQPTITTVTAKSQNAQILQSLSDTSKSENKIAENSRRKSNTPDAIEILDLSGKSSRSPSREKSNSPPVATQTYPNNCKDIKQTNSGNLEAALNRLKQQQQNQVSSSSNMIGRLSKSSNDKQKKDETSTTTTTNTGLQNLQLLSESATNREKLAIKTQRALPMLSKLDVGKMRATANVRQQNASVRNIPNPSALAFRNNQPTVPMLTNITKTTTNSIPKTQALSSNLTTATTSSASSSASLSTTTSGGIDSSRTKNLEQLAHTLNIRAAAAADISGKTGNQQNPTKVNVCASAGANTLITSTTTDSASISSIAPYSLGVTTTSAISANSA